MRFQLHQDNVLLRTFDLSEVEMLYKLIDENRTHLGKWLSWVEKTTSVKVITDFLLSERTKWNLGKGLYLGIWYDGKLCGIVSLDNIDMDNKKAELGYWLAKAMSGKGIMLKACKMLISYAFNDLKLHRIDVSHITENIRSKNVICNLGFTHEGLRRDNGFLNHHYVNHDVYGLLSHQWI